MTTHRTALDELAARSGIEAEFRDARGETRRTAPETQSALLAAMGVQVDGEDAARVALDALDRAEWSRPLPPVQVCYADRGPVSVEVTLPAGTGELSWTVEVEDGGTREGTAGYGALELVGRRELDGQALERRRLPLGDGLPWGYHRLCVQPGDAETVLVVTPGQCWLPETLQGEGRLWGISVQMYLLRSATDWGIGDYGDLRHLAGMLAKRGADVIGLNPLHAGFPDAPEHASPYSPASRLLLNVLNLDISAIPELVDCADAREILASDEFRARLDACRSARLVDYAGVAALKLPVLERLFAASRTQPDGARWQAFEAFRQVQGEAWQRGCRFLALREHFHAQDPARADWHAWPEEYRDPASPAVARFAQEHADRVLFHAWLQWLADTQLGAAAEACEGMAVGLYRDLAVGADRAGAETWSSPKAVVSDAQVGAPPDIYNTAGQDWGLPPFHPRALREEGYRSFIELVRANMRHAGGLRIDHVMALQHLYWVPQGKSPAEGAYVEYPMEDLVGILALESQRHRCLVVGEDLGTVPEGFRERMEAARILSYRVLFFEREGSAFIPPERYPHLALAVAGSHDLPTLRGWWESGDIVLREGLGLYPEGAAQAARKERERDRAQVLEALRAQGLLPGGAEPDTLAFAEAAHRYLARTRSALAVVQIDDITDEADPVNVPATSFEHPNWRRRLSVPLEELDAGGHLDAMATLMAGERGRRP